MAFLLIKFAKSTAHVPAPTDSEMSARGLSRELQELAQALSWVIPAQICCGRHAALLLCKAGAWGSQASPTPPLPSWGRFRSVKSVGSRPWLTHNTLFRGCGRVCDTALFHRSRTMAVTYHSCCTPLEGEHKTSNLTLSPLLPFQKQPHFCLGT